MVSITFGRTTGTPSRSAWVCMSRSLRLAPPSTLKSRKACPDSTRMASARSKTERAMPSSVARARWAAVVPRSMPRMTPRASGRQWGAPRPASAGAKVTPPLSFTLRASGSISAALRISPSPSRSHCTAAPAMKEEPSSA